MGGDQPYPFVVSMCSPNEIVNVGSRMNHRLSLVLGTSGLVSVACGYLMESVRQRGDCELGDPRPDTLVVSVLLIVLGGAGAGIIGLMVEIIRLLKLKHLRWFPIVVPVCSVLAGASLFLFVNSGPGGWFQYCGN